MANTFVFKNNDIGVVNMGIDSARNEAPSAASEVIDDDFYPTKGTPKILIICNDKCDKNPLSGYRNDADALKSMWEDFGCHVKLRENARRDAMWDHITDFATHDLTGEETFCATFILSHGGYDKDLGEFIYGTDEGKNGCIAVEEMLRLFDNKNPNLREMPRIFILQCCRGNEKPQGVSKGPLPAGPTDDKLPQVSDTLVMYATQLKNVAIVDEDGSWLIKALVQVFRDRNETEHVADMLTMVNHAVAKRIVGTSSNPALVGVKCMSEIRSTLRYKLKVNSQQPGK